MNKSVNNRQFQACARTCIICKTAQREHFHALASCPFLPAVDRPDFTKYRQVDVQDPLNDYDAEILEEVDLSPNMGQLSINGTNDSSSVRRISVKGPPSLWLF